MNGIPRPLVRANQGFILLFVLLALVTRVHELLLIPFAIGVYALIFRSNLLFKMVRPLLKHPNDHYVLEDVDQQRFNQWIAVFCLGLGWVSFTFGWNVAGYIFSGMVGLASGIALCGFCIGCFIRYQYLMWRHKRLAK